MKIKDWMMEAEQVRRENDNDAYSEDGTVQDPFETLIEGMGFSIIDPKAEHTQQVCL
jgi:hypothetical protein